MIKYSEFLREYAETVKDVEDFIRYRGTNYLFCGYWKVYHNAEAAMEIFESYRSVREETNRAIIEGGKLRDMIKYIRE